MNNKPQQPGKVFVADAKNKVLKEKSPDYPRGDSAVWDKDDYRKIIEKLKQYPATWLTEYMDGREFVEGVDFILEKRSEFYLGSYMNTCVFCKQVFSGTDKRWFCCQKCCDEIVAIDNLPQRQTTDVMGIEKMYDAFAKWYKDDGSYDTFLRSEAFKAIKEYAQTLASPLPASSSIEGQNPDCSQHKKEIAGISDMKVLAEMIGDLHYDSLYGLLNYLSEKMVIDASKDRKAGRKMLAQSLYNAASLIGDASEEISQAYDICKPFMKEDEK